MPWEIGFRGDLNEDSELNMDGSTSMRAISVVRGEELPDALTTLIVYLRQRGINISAVEKCISLTGEALKTADIETVTASERLTDEKPVTFVYAISSEAEGSEEGEEAC